MERSAILLISDTASNITEIAHMYGFGDSSVYTKSFKRHYGMSPSEFKKSKKRQA